MAAFRTTLVALQIFNYLKPWWKKDQLVPIKNKEPLCDQSQYSVSQLRIISKKVTCLVEFQVTVVTKKEPKSDDRLSKFDWHDLSTIFGGNNASHNLKVFYKPIKQIWSNFNLWLPDVYLFCSYLIATVDSILFRSSKDQLIFIMKPAPVTWRYL